MSEVLARPTYLREDETIMMILHRHWIVFVYNIGFLLILLITTMVAVTMQDVFVSMFGTAIFWGFMALFWIFFLTFVMLSWMHNELDLFIITDKRIISIEQVGPLTRMVTECSLDRVQEVNARISGILQTVLHYGEVHIHTASEESNMIVRYAPNPVENANKMDTIINDFNNQKVTLV